MNLHSNNLLLHSQRFFQISVFNFGQFGKINQLFCFMVLFFIVSSVAAKGQSEPPYPAECLPDANPNPIFFENYCTGGATRDWQALQANGAFDHEIEGYASKTSVNAGEQIDFYVSVKNTQRYTLQIYRMG